MRIGSAGRPDCTFDVFGYDDHLPAADVVLLMGYDAQSEEIRRQNSDCLIGVIDLRPRQAINLRGIDFLLPNGFESWQQWRSTGLPQTFLFLNELSSNFPPRQEYEVENQRGFCLGYLGNAIHLKRLRQVASEALSELSGSVALDVWLYVSEQVSRKDWSWLPVEPRVFSIGKQSLTEFLAGVDLGLVPQIKPVTFSDRLSQVARALGRDRGNVVDLKFKPTTNPGRVLTFSQAGIPVIADSTPSVNQLVGSQFPEFVVFDASGWASALKWSISSNRDRQIFGRYLHEAYLQIADPWVQVDRILRLVRELRRDQQGE